MIQLSDKNIKPLNTKKGIILFLQENLKPIKTLRTIQYESRMKKLQEELIKLQHWVVNENEKVVIHFTHYVFSRSICPAYGHRPQRHLAV